MGYWIVAGVLVVLALIGARVGLRHRLDKASHGGGDADPEIAQALREATRDIDRGRGASHHFF
ncbi:hypothetical protein [Georgenia ruanii]|uniref:hypothetical protein n=1 Tax=Georgenia ruanii TaxID=348442 RepID=UPI001264EAE5|nr:hypothetical protein [Georgenia ruanii]